MKISIPFIVLLSICHTDALQSFTIRGGTGSVKPTPLEQLQPTHFGRIINKNDRTSTSLDSSTKKEESEDEGNGIDDPSDSTKQGLYSSAFNLVKANLGSGVFALPVSRTFNLFINAVRSSKLACVAI
jgi:hypothetical protein